MAKLAGIGDWTICESSDDFIDFSKAGRWIRPNHNLWNTVAGWF
jgi:hypothetical protein